MRIGVGEQFVVVDLHDEGNLVRIAARHGAQHAESRCYGVAAALKSEKEDIFRIEIVGIRSERSPGRMLDALIHGQDRDVARATQPAVRKDALQVAERRKIAIRSAPDAIHRIGTGQMEPLARDRATDV